MKNSIFILLIAITTFVSPVYSQNILSDRDTSPPKHLMIFKISPLGFMDIQNTVLLSTEIFLNPDVSYQLELGYIYKDNLSKPDNTELDNNKFNTKIKTEFRFYLNKDEDEQIKEGLYIAPQFLYKQIYFTRTCTVCNEWEKTISWLGTSYDCVQESSNTYSIRRLEYGGHLNFGYQWIYQERFVLDCYSGIGIRKITTKTFGKEGIPYPKDGFQINLGDNFNELHYGILELIEDSQETDFSMTLGFRLGLVLNTKKKIN